MRSPVALRALFRVELRRIRRHAGRSWLVVLLIAVPVAAMVGGSTLFAITQRTPEELRAQALGRAALRIEARADGDLEAASAVLPEDARVESVLVGREEVRVPGRRLVARSTALDPKALETGGLAKSMLRITAGRAPRGPDEIALSAVLSRGLERSIGETVMVGSDSELVTGTVVDPENIDLPVVLRALRPLEADRAQVLLVDLPDGEVESVAAVLREEGYRVIVRSELGEPDEFESIAIFVIGGFGFFEAALVIAAAFAVDLRRRQREIGLLGANGASPGDLRASIAASALALACAGAVLGVALGCGAAAALHPFLDGWNRRMNGPYEVSAQHVIGAVLLGLATAVVAAAFPARSATRLPIRIALSGRRPVTERPRAWLVVGLALVVGGLASMLWGARSSGAAAGIGILGGSILGVLGLGGCSPYLLHALTRAAAPLPLPWRLAVRDAGRFSARNGPVVTAVLAGMSVSVMLASLIGSIQSLMSTGPATLRDDQLVVDGPSAGEVALRLSREPGCVAIAALEALYSQGELVRARSGLGERVRADDAWVAVGSDELLRALDAEAGVEGLRNGGVVALVQPSDVSEGSANEPTAELVAGLERTIARVALTRVESSQWVRGVRAPVFAIGRESLAALHLDAGAPPQASSTPWIARFDSAVTAGVLARAQSIAVETAGAAETSVDAALLQREPERVFVHVVLLFCFATGLIVVFVATALSSVESAADTRVLHTVGAAPTTLCSHLAARAGYLAFLGGVLAIPAGLVPSYGLLSLADVDLEFSVPWGVTFVVALGLPAIAFGGTWMFAALRRASSAVRASTSRSSVPVTRPALDLTSFPTTSRRDPS